MSLENLTLGTEIRAAREEAGYSIKKVADIIRIRETLMTEIEAEIFLVAVEMHMLGDISAQLLRY